MTIKKTFDGIEYEESSGNVFADLGCPDAEERRAKLRPAHAPNQLLKSGI